MAEYPLPSIRIRVATPVDNTLLAELGERTFFDTFAGDNTPEDMAAYLAAAFSPQNRPMNWPIPKIPLSLQRLGG